MRPSVIGCGRPVRITRIAALTLVGRPSDLAKLLKVPNERMPSGCLVSARFRTAQPIVPSPPATMIVAFGDAIDRRSILGSNSTTRLRGNELRSFASIAGLIEPALELRIRRLVARLALTLLAGRDLVLRLRPGTIFVMQDYLFRASTGSESRRADSAIDGKPSPSASSPMTSLGQCSPR